MKCIGWRFHPCKAPVPRRGWRGYAVKIRRLLAAAALPVLLGAVTPACAHVPCPDGRSMNESPRLTPQLRSAVSEDPDSTVLLMLRTTRSVTDADRESLEACGLAVGSVIDDIVTGEARADAVPRIAALPFVQYVQLSRRISAPPPMPHPDTGDTEPRSR